MWTPRRIFLLIVGIALFTGAYLSYTIFLGSVDGLPKLPERYLTAIDEADIVVDNRPVSPTIIRLQQAFGPNSLEVTDPIVYKTKLEIRDKGMVFACGQQTFAPEPSRFVTVAPFSVAFFGKPRPAHLREPGEMPEISTFHAEKAILEFNKPVSSLQDFREKAKLVGMELVSTPDVPSPDPRKGQIIITNNQRSEDPNDTLVFRTPGPLFYRAPEEKPTQAATDAPQIWTTASVEMEDRRNLPRPLRSEAPPVVPTRGDDLRSRYAVGNILMGVTLPPPTVTAEGMKIYLKQDADGENAGSGYSGVRLIELTEKVQMNLWGGSGGFPGTEEPETTSEPISDDLPEEAIAVIGGLGDAAAVASILENNTLLLIETLGPFHYDFDTSIAKFEAAPIANPALSNHVTVTRLSATGGQDNLFCKSLVIEFNNAAGSETAEGTPPSSSDRPGQGMTIKSLVATGEHVFLAVEAEQLSAQGTELRYAVDQGSGRTETTLIGSPVVAVRERNRMMGGSPNNPAEVVIVSEPVESEQPGKKQTNIHVRGPGRVELFDAADDDSPVRASWGKSLIQERQIVGGMPQDLLKFEGGGSFADTEGEMELTADRLWLWLGKEEQEQTKTALSSQADVKPQRLVAFGNVDGKSPEMMIRKTDQLTIWFRDLPEPAENPADPNQLPPPKPIPGQEPVEPAPPPGLNDPKAEPEEEEKPNQPIYLSARVIESWVVRMPTSAPPAKSKEKGKADDTAIGTKYELERARCEDRVMVHQAPTDPEKTARGIDIFGTRLNLDHTPAGSVLTVHGAESQWAQVYFEDLSLFGPVVVIDQPNNAVSVDGRGMLRMPSSSELAGERSDSVSDLEIQWATHMRFFGAKATAEFLGQVHAVQKPREKEKAQAGKLDGDKPVVQTAQLIVPEPDNPDGVPTQTKAVLLCHRLDTTFDRPVYFNQFRRDGAAKSEEEEKTDGNPKLRSALCTPMPDDALVNASGPGVIRNVVFSEEVTTPDGSIARAQRLTARQIDVKVDDREQIIFATGPGEVRILQFGSKNITDEGEEDPNADEADKEMKLTVVRFPSRMVAKDTDKLFQEASFDDGARVVQIPSQDLNQQVVEHALPERGVFLSCTELLKVSTNKAKKQGPPEQWMTAVGNAEFRTDDYQGVASRITYDGKSTIFEGSKGRLARLYRKRRGVNNQDYHTGEKIVYNRDGTVTGSGSVGGSITP